MKTILFIILLNSTLYAQDNKKQVSNLGLGLGLGFSQSSQLYKYESSDSLTLPTIVWNTDNFHIRGLNFSYYLRKGFPSFNLTLQPVLLQVDNDSSSFNKNLSKRYRTVNFGFETIFPFPWFATGIHLQHDLLNRYASYIAIFEIKKKFPLAEFLSIAANLNFQYLTDNYVNYYFGVNSHEVNSERPFYRTHSGYSFGPSLTFIYLFDNSGYQISLTNKYTKFSNEISSSPLVKRDDQWNFVLSLSKFLN